jgi:hypothetical protein
MHYFASTLKQGMTLEIGNRDQIKLCQTSEAKV